jgi:hypothetical protein
MRDILVDERPTIFSFKKDNSMGLKISYRMKKNRITCAAILFLWHNAA